MLVYSMSTVMSFTDIFYLSGCFEIVNNKLISWSNAFLMFVGMFSPSFARNCNSLLTGSDRESLGLMTQDFHVFLDDSCVLMSLQLMDSVSFVLLLGSSSSRCRYCGVYRGGWGTDLGTLDFQVSWRLSKTGVFKPKPPKYRDNDKAAMYFQNYLYWVRK